jgi:hypothetical protein
MVMACLVYLYSAENSPTRFRAIFVGVTGFLGNFGSVVAPFVVNWLQNQGISTGSSFAVCAIIGIIFLMCGEETFGKDLSSEVEEEGDAHFHDFEETDSDDSSLDLNELMKNQGGIGGKCCAMDG